MGEVLLLTHSLDALVKSTLTVYGEKKNLGKELVGEAGLLLVA